MVMFGSTPTVMVEKHGHVLHMGLNRPAKRNAFNTEMLDELGRAYERLERDDELRAGMLYAQGDNITAALDLAEVGPRLMAGSLDWPEDARNPWRNDGRPWTKPIVAAAQGWCLTLGIELLLAADIRIASGRYTLRPAGGPAGHLTLRRGHHAATARGGLGQRDALSADRRRIRCRPGSANRPRPGGCRTRRSARPSRGAGGTDRNAVGATGVRITLAAARRANRAGERAAEDRFGDDVVALFKTQDGVEGIQSFIERRQARFVGA
jgi:enoyl-CoA hydratase